MSEAKLRGDWVEKLQRRSWNQPRQMVIGSRRMVTRATLTAGGRFALAGVVINVNGVTDPEAVARRVAEVLRRRASRNNKQRRGTRTG